MLSAYFDHWAGFWRSVANALDEGTGAVNWFVEFGSLRKQLEEIHPDTGLPELIAPIKDRIEQALKGKRGSLTVTFRVDPRRGLMHALTGPESLVRAAQASLAD